MLQYFYFSSYRYYSVRHFVFTSCCVILHEMTQNKSLRKIFPPSLFFCQTATRRTGFFLGPSTVGSCRYHAHKLYISPRLMACNHKYAGHLSTRCPPRLRRSHISSLRADLSEALPLWILQLKPSSACRISFRTGWLFIGAR